MHACGTFPLPNRQSCHRHRHEAWRALRAPMGRRRLRWCRAASRAGGSKKLAKGSGSRVQSRSVDADPIALPKRTVSMLRAHRVEQLERRLLLGQGKITETALVFSNVEGNMLWPDDLTRICARVVLAKKLPRVTFQRCGTRMPRCLSMLDLTCSPSLAGSATQSQASPSIFTGTSLRAPMPGG